MKVTLGMVDRFLDMVWSSCANALGVTIVAGLGWWLLTASQPPSAGLLSIGAISAVVFYATNAIKHELAWIECQLTGHWGVEFKKKYQDVAHCPRCKEPIASRAPGSDTIMQLCEDTLHQRISRLEAALNVKE